MQDKDTHLLEEAYESIGKLRSPNKYEPFQLTPQEEEVVASWIGRTSLSDYLKILAGDNPEVYQDLIEHIVLINVKDPKGM